MQDHSYIGNGFALGIVVVSTLNSHFCRFDFNLLHLHFIFHPFLFISLTINLFEVSHLSPNRQILISLISLLLFLDSYIEENSSLSWAFRVCNIVSENPRTREKNPWKQVQGLGGLRFWDFQVYRTGTWRFSSHMVFLGNFLADRNTRKCHFNKKIPIIFVSLPWKLHNRYCYYVSLSAAPSTR